MIKVGLVGYGKAGKAVATVLAQDARYQLCWIARRKTTEQTHLDGYPMVPLVGLDRCDFDNWFDSHPVDAVVDFALPETVYQYADALIRHRSMLVSAVSAYNSEQQAFLRQLGEVCPVMSSPNITLGINFLLMAAKMLRDIAPFADVEVVEQHFREKPEVSGTARKIASSLGLEDEHITSLRMGGIVGHHEVIFGFPHQTVRLVHDAIRREAFGTGVAFALQELATCPAGCYSFDELMMKKIRHQLLAQEQT